MIRKFAFLIATLLAQSALAAPACFTPGKKFDSRFVGNWEIAQWNMRYSIRAKGKQICMYARDAQADEFFEIPELQWDGKVLQASFFLPSTKWRTQSRLSIESANRVRDDYSNKDGKHTDFWTRRK